MKYAWIDASAGASGDGLLGALIDAGASLQAVQEAIRALALPESVEFSGAEVSRAGLRAYRLELEIGASIRHRNLPEIRELVDGRALRVFERLARAEARVHGVDVDAVHFHEMGAVDCLVDVVGTLAALDDLGISRIGCSTVAVGHGKVTTEHGSLPVPVPAVSELFTEVGAPIVGGPVEHEACTPTAAGLLAELVTDWGPLPELGLRSMGVGACFRDPAQTPNVVRVFVGETADIRAVNRLELECNVDDLDPRVWPYVIDCLLKVGVDDAWVVPIEMKKRRSAFTLHVLFTPSLLPAVSEIVVKETSTIGYRVRGVSKHELPREIVTVEVEGNPVRLKVARLDGELVNVSAEFSDAVGVAEKTGLPLATVLRDATNRHRDA